MRLCIIYVFYRYGIEGSVYLKNTSGDVAQPDPCTKVGVVFLSGKLVEHASFVFVSI